jgi:hypothetical protein
MNAVLPQQKNSRGHILCDRHGRRIKLTLQANCTRNLFNFVCLDNKLFELPLDSGGPSRTLRRQPECIQCISHAVQFVLTLTVSGAN